MSTTTSANNHTNSSVYTGKEHSWARSPLTRLNRGLRPLTPTIALITITILFNGSQTGHHAYKWLNSNYSSFQINAWWSFGITSGVYWIAGLLYMMVDLLEWPRWLFKYKIQPEKKVTAKDYRLVCSIALRNQLLVVLPLATTSAILAPFRTNTPLPGALETIFTFIFCLACEEIGFYHVHRALHGPKYYRYFHKLHHEFTAPVALSSTYCTLTEHLLSNITPIMLGVLILRSHWSIVIMFFCGLELGTLSTHSGYNLPFNHNALQHDWHHYMYTENFGPTGAMDKLHGTNKVFRAWLGELGKRDGGDINTAARKELIRLEFEGKKKHPGPS